LEDISRAENVYSLGSRQIHAQIEFQGLGKRTTPDSTFSQS